MRNHAGVPAEECRDPRDVVAAFDRAVDDGDVAALDAVCHPEMTTHSFAPNMPQGIAGMRRFVERSSAAGRAGRWEWVVTVCEGEFLVQYGTRTLDWPGGPFRGFDVPAGSVRRDCAFMFRIRDGLITDRWAIRDDLAMMEQLGAITAPRPGDVLQGTISTYDASSSDRPQAH